MRKSLNLLSVIIILLTAALFYALPWIEMEFAGSAHDTEQDKRQYEFYTPEIVKKMPRISARYSFDFANNTGPASHAYAVNFYATKDVGKIESFLTSTGYRQSKCDFESVCWRGSDPQETIYVGTLKGEQTVIVQVVYNFT